MIELLYNVDGDNMSKKVYIIIVSILVVVLGTLTTILIIKGPVKKSNTTYGTEAKEYLKTFDLELREENGEKYYVVTGLTSGYGRSLTKIEYPETIDGITVKRIETNENKFIELKNVKYLNIPKTIEFIGIGSTNEENFFDGASNLESINVSSLNEKYTSINGVLYNKEKNILLKYPAKKQSTSFEIIESVEIINDYAFYGTSFLTSVTISKNVSTIKNSAFRNSSALSTVDFTNCLNLEVIESFAFASSDKLDNVKLPNTLKELGSNVFAGCKILSYLFIPSSVVTFGYNITSVCPNIVIYTSSDNLDFLKENAKHFSTSKNFEEKIMAE